MSNPNSQSPKVFSVSQLTQRLQWTLRSKYSDVWVSGEMTNLTQPASGHIYFSLGDKTAQMKAVIWRSQAEQISFDLSNGMQVICQGEIDVYPPRGVYQLIVRNIEPQGVGAAQLALKKLHQRLAAEGLFDPESKKSIPESPGRIAVVTSPTGAAIQDFLKVVLRRWPHAELLVIPAKVQGEGSALEIAQGVVVAGLLANRPDVLVVTRGGGSAEDLASFNDERVVRAIAACEIPVVSGVGHEIDVTLTDLVADRRALTPSEAGEFVVPEWNRLLDRINECQSRLSSALSQRLEVARQKIAHLQSRRVMTDPYSMLHVASRRIDECEMRLQRAGDRNLERCRNRMAILAGRLQATSPLSVLARGYSVTEDADGTIVKNASQLSKGDRIVTRLEQGFVESEVQLTIDPKD